MDPNIDPTKYQMDPNSDPYYNPTWNMSPFTSSNSQSRWGATLPTNTNQLPTIEELQIGLTQE